MGDAMKVYGCAGLVQQRLGITPEIGTKVATIVLLAGSIEYFVERAIWRLANVDPKGTRPVTDARAITDLIGLLARSAANLPNPTHRAFLQTWCEVAGLAFTMRHDIIHGVPTRGDDVLSFFRNPRWEGESRKREFGSFYAEPYALDMLVDAMATLLRPLAEIVNGVDLSDVVSAKADRAMKYARSLLGECADKSYNPSFEKY